jgi:hypothetical protein
MKHFFIIFSAILASAAVIIGVLNYREKQERESQTILEVLIAYTRSAKQTRDYATTAKKINPDVLLRNYQNNEIRTFARYLKGDLPQGADILGLKFNFVNYSRDVVQLAREKCGGDNKVLTWAQQIEADLNTYFPLN